MNKYDLSILIPARNEMFVARTVEDILINKRGNTEIIVALDGEWANPGIVDHPDVTVIYFPEAIGQRAATNQACRLSHAKYVMKLDAHCALDEGFDVKMMEAMQDNWTMVPLMRNLHAFDWVCPEGHRRYQSPSGACKECEKPTTRDVVWIAKGSPQSTSFRFDKTLHFQYFNEFKNRPEGKGDITPTLSLQGSCFMLTREKYWELNICDEGHGSWGQQGVEVALKTWLSGGEVMCNQKTWYAHMFRTQGGDFGFPYPNSGGAVDHARKYSRKLWLEGKWDKAIHDLPWLFDKFKPVPDWEDYGKPTKGIIFYTDNRVNIKVARAVQKRLRSIGLPIVSASLKPMDKMGKNIHIKSERGYLTMFKQILAALEASDADIIFHCEHDVVYHPSHFDFIPPRKDVFYYNTNVWKIRSEDGFALRVDDAKQVSGLCAYREFLIEDYKKRIERIERLGHFERGWGNEPGTKNLERGGFSDYISESWTSEAPNLDVRGTWNLTINRWTKDKFRHKDATNGWTEGNLITIPGWNIAQDDFDYFISSI